MAATTVATDGLRVYVMFSNGDLAAFNFDGSVAWAKFLGTPKNQYGHATSLLTWQDRVIVQFDQGEVDDKLSKLTAFDGATGALVCSSRAPSAHRGRRRSHSTPQANRSSSRSPCRG